MADWICPDCGEHPGLGGSCPCGHYGTDVDVMRAEAAEKQLHYADWAAAEMATDREELVQLLSQAQYDLTVERNRVDGLSARAEVWKVDAEGLAEALRQVVRRGEDIGFPPGACGRCVEPAKDALAAHEKLKAEEARD